MTHVVSSGSRKRTLSGCRRVHSTGDFESARVEALCSGTASGIMVGFETFFGQSGRVPCFSGTPAYSTDDPEPRAAVRRVASGGLRTRVRGRVDGRGRVPCPARGVRATARPGNAGGLAAGLALPVAQGPDRRSGIAPRARHGCSGAPHKGALGTDSSCGKLEFNIFRCTRSSSVRRSASGHARVWRRPGLGDAGGWPSQEPQPGPRRHAVELYRSRSTRWRRLAPWWASRRPMLCVYERCTNWDCPARLGILGAEWNDR